MWHDWYLLASHLYQDDPKPAVIKERSLYSPRSCDVKTIFIIILICSLVFFHCIHIYADDAKEMVSKTARALAQIMLLVPNFIPYMLYPHTFTVNKQQTNKQQQTPTIFFKMLHLNYNCYQKSTYAIVLVPP